MRVFSKPSANLNGTFDSYFCAIRELSVRDSVDVAIRSDRNEALRLSDAELQQHAPAASVAGNIGASTRIVTDHGDVVVEIAATTIELARTFREAETSAECHSALAITDRELDKWIPEKRNQSGQRRSSVLPLGAELTFPDTWERV